MTRPALTKPYVYMCAVCWEHNSRHRRADWLTAEGWHVCDQHLEHAETHRADTVRIKPR